MRYSKLKHQGFLQSKLMCIKVASDSRLWGESGSVLKHTTAHFLCDSCSKQSHLELYWYWCLSGGWVLLDSTCSVGSVWFFLWHFFKNISWGICYLVLPSTSCCSNLEVQCDSIPALLIPILMATSLYWQILSLCTPERRSESHNSQHTSPATGRLAVIHKDTSFTECRLSSMLVDKVVMSIDKHFKIRFLTSPPFVTTMSHWNDAR